MNYLNEGIKKLRAVYVIKAKDKATKTVRLWRGMRNLDVGDKFLADNSGGTEARRRRCCPPVCEWQPHGHAHAHAHAHDMYMYMHMYMCMYMCMYVHAYAHVHV